MRRPTLGPTTIGLTALVSLLLALPALAQPAPGSQDLPIVTLDRQSYSPFHTAQRLVLSTEAEVVAFFGSGPALQMLPQIDFAREDVLVAVMGTRPSGGYGIEIRKVTLMTGGITGGHAFVEVVEGGPPPGMMVTMALTAPLHVVKVPKGAIAYHWTTVQPPRGFSELSLLVRDPVRQTTEQVVVQAGGDVRLTRSSPTARYAPIDATLSFAELRGLQDAFAAADAPTLPGTIQDPNVYVMAPSTVDLGWTLAGSNGGPSADSGSLSASLGVYEGYAPRVEPLVSALRAVVRRLTAPGFDQIYLSYSGGFVVHSDAISVAADGTVTVARTGYAGRPSPFFTGQATAAELKTLQDAIAAADVTTLPAVIDPNLLVADVPSLRIVTSLGGQDHTTDLRIAGMYAGFEARLEPVVEAVNQIAQRVEAEGRVTVSVLARREGDRVYASEYYVSRYDTLQGLVGALAGETLEIEGRLHRYGSVTVLEVFSVQGEARWDLSLRTSPSYFAPTTARVAQGAAVAVSAVSRSGYYLYVTAGGESGWVPTYWLTFGK